MAVESRSVIDIGTVVVGKMMIAAAVMAAAIAVVAETALAILAVVVTLHHHHHLGRAVERRTDPSVEMAMAWMMIVT